MKLLRVARSGKEIGQWMEDQLEERLAIGELHLTDYVWWEGALSWVELGTLVEKPMQRMASEEQRESLLSLGYKGDLETVTQDVARVWIGQLLADHTSTSEKPHHLSSATPPPITQENQSKMADRSILYWLRYNAAEKTRSLEETNQMIASHTERIRSGIAEIRDWEVKLSALPKNALNEGESQSREIHNLIEARRDNIREYEEELAAERAKLPGLRHAVRVAKRLRLNALLSLITGSLHLTDSDDYIVLHDCFEELDRWYNVQGQKHQVPTPEHLKEVVEELDHQDPFWEINHPQSFFDAFPLIARKLLLS
jgi:hypothetical protein